MNFEVNYQESYSRSELLLRSFLGYFYILIPHAFILVFFTIWSQILTLISFWVIIFTGSYPKSFFNFQVKLLKWFIRVILRLYNLADGYPAFGIDSEDEAFQLDISYPEKLSRGTLLLKIFFGIIYVIIPHGFTLVFRMFATFFLTFLAFWAVLFTGKYPESWFNFNLGTLRWILRLTLYRSYMSDKYPPFSGK